MMDDEKSGEADLIIAKMRKKKPGASDEGGDDEEGEPVGDEAELSAAEGVFRILRGREPKESEAADLRDALKTFNEACGGGE